MERRPFPSPSPPVNVKPRVNLNRQCSPYYPQPPKIHTPICIHVVSVIIIIIIIIINIIIRIFVGRVVLVVLVVLHVTR